MQRLTLHRNRDGSVSQPTDLDWNKVLDKLINYEDAEEQGLLVRLPCRAGDRVYVKDGDQVRLGTVKAISITTEVVIRGIYNHFRFTTFAGVWGDSVFASQKEAEAALKGEALAFVQKVNEAPTVMPAEEDTNG